MERPKPPAIQAGCKHGEAYCHMQYTGSDSTKTCIVTIWNSRDGVTPFMLYLKEIGLDLQHTNWHRDVFDPKYKPRKGDLIWRDWKHEEMVEAYGKQFDRIRADLLVMASMTEEEIQQNPRYKWLSPAQMEDIINAGKEAWISLQIKSTQPGEPHLELVKEDWI
jgi:hypothetical protein